jgi:hypothetical protein
LTNTVKFGSAGNPESFYAQGGKSSLEMPKWLAGMGLDAYEYQCTRGVKISAESAEKLGALARENSIDLSVHSPYYINISGTDPEKLENGKGCGKYGGFQGSRAYGFGNGHDAKGRNGYIQKDNTQGACANGR